jgi:hypothetical protein
MAIETGGDICYEVVRKKQMDGEHRQFVQQKLQINHKFNPLQLKPWTMDVPKYKNMFIHISNLKNM